MKYITEHSQYRVKETRPDVTVVERLPSGQVLILENDYIKDHCVTDVVEVDQKSNLTTIRQFLEDIPPFVIFTVEFRTKDKRRTASEMADEREKRLTQLAELMIDPAYEDDGFDDAITEFLMDVMDNPITEVIPGDLRKMTCYKTGKTVHGGLYEVVDVDILGTDTHPIRTVNPQTAISVTYGGVRKHVN